MASGNPLLFQVHRMTNSIDSILYRFLYVSQAYVRYFEIYENGSIEFPRDTKQTSMRYAKSSSSLQTKSIFIYILREITTANMFNKLLKQLSPDDFVFFSSFFFSFYVFNSYWLCSYYIHMFTYVPQCRTSHHKLILLFCM